MPAGALLNAVAGMMSERRGVFIFIVLPSTFCRLDEDLLLDGVE